ncbi:signal peptide protein [Streptomyces bottropensis]|uniref:signal peptide protein n=1 Tax=Streptomyces bottropensis TaxID=42235 RepID=UPI0036ABAF11
MTLLVGISGLATSGAATATPQPAPAAAAASVSSQTQTQTQVQPPVSPTGFVDLRTRPLPADSRQHTFTVTYRNDAATDRTVAPQLLVVSPDTGPFLSPSDITLEHRQTDGCWEAVEVGTQTGTLFTDLSTARRTLHPGQTLTEVYRLTVITPHAKTTVAPRVALYD